MAFSYQLYSSRNFGPLSHTLQLLSDLGYEAVEGYGGLYDDIADLPALKSDLDDAGLQMRTGHFGLDMIEDRPDQILEIARTLNMTDIYVPYILPDDRPTSAEGWRAYGARVEAAGKPIVEAGLGFGYHNHDFEFVRTDGVMPMDELLAGGPSLSWEMDVAWVVRGGVDPLDWIARYKDRISAVHVKDIAKAGENLDEDGWADVGAGEMDWAGLMNALRQTPAAHYVMEHDNPSDEKRFAGRSIASAKTY